MVTNEKQLAEAIMNGELKIELTDKLVSGCEKIMAPSGVVWASILSAFVASTFFWAGGSAILLGITVGLPAVLTVCGGVGGVVFVTLGAQGTLCAYRLLIAAQTIDVLTSLRDNYDLNESVLVRK
ncbi:MAG: hypothetical protein J5965_10755 [Aeriscardovia sp.]|nr:hypothetical protein [Aeriscardovia sp.]